MDYLIIVALTLAGLYFHWWLFQRIRRWADRDLALSMADSAAKQAYMLQSLSDARLAGVRRRDLPAWLENAAAQYPES
jgi:hypothetical protein